MDQWKNADPAEQPDPMLTQPELPGKSAAAVVEAGQATAPAARRPAATFIFLTVMLDMLALGMIAPVLPRLIEGFMGGDASSAAKMLGLFGTTFAVMQFFFSPVLGSLSDRFGRRPIVLLSNFGLAADYLLMAWAPALPWLFAGRVISGVSASSIPTAMAYMADVTPHEKRAGAFGMLSAAFGVGFVVGPAMGGLLGSVNPRLPFLVSAGLSLLNGLYGTFVLPESLKKENRAGFSWKRANPIGSMVMLMRSRSLLLLSTVLILGYVAQQSLMNVYVIYTDYRYHWSAREVGLSLGFLGVFTIIYGMLVRKATPRYGERLCIFFGLTMGLIGYTWFGLAGTGMMFLDRHSHPQPDELHLAFRAGPDEQRNQPAGTRPDAGCDQRSARRRGHRGAVAIHLHLCALRRQPRHQALAGSTLLHGGHHASDGDPRCGRGHTHPSPRCARRLSPPVVPAKPAGSPS